MKGIWKGTYWFTSNVHDSVKKNRTEFEITIENDDNSKISGTIFDNIETGGTRGIGTISGTVKGNKIKFVKRMPIKTIIFPNGEKIEKKEPHSPIYYEGSLNNETNEFEGTWKFKRRITIINGKLGYTPETKGAWKMKKIRC
ncbi:hypothetical protein [Aureivirga sp. CE67]|uniref:hypothetical protein n=1 Tax=Aureivirga sp. CE67 TaxID=1788983 RepID=UPI0018CAE0A3|nr:hypothetical protein [Aureivirga sp. CE67]